MANKIDLPVVKFDTSTTLKARKIEFRLGDTIYEGIPSVTTGKNTTLVTSLKKEYGELLAQKTKEMSDSYIAFRDQVERQITDLAHIVPAYTFSNHQLRNGYTQTFSGDKLIIYVPVTYNVYYILVRLDHTENQRIYKVNEPMVGRKAYLAIYLYRVLNTLNPIHQDQLYCPTGAALVSPTTFDSLDCQFHKAEGLCTGSMNVQGIYKQQGLEGLAHEIMVMLETINVNSLGRYRGNVKVGDVPTWAHECVCGNHDMRDKTYIESIATPVKASNTSDTISTSSNTTSTSNNTPSNDGWDTSGVDSTGIESTIIAQERPVIHVDEYVEPHPEPPEEPGWETNNHN